MGAVSPLNNFRYDPNALTPDTFSAPGAPTFDPSIMGQAPDYRFQGQAQESPFATMAPVPVNASLGNVGFPTGNNLAAPATDMFQLNAGVGQSFKPGYAPVLSSAGPGSISLPGMETSAPVSYPLSLGPNQFEMAQKPDLSAMYGLTAMPGGQNTQVPAWMTPPPTTYMPPGTRFNALA